MRAVRAAACLMGVMALGLLAGGTPERDIYVSVKMEGGPPPCDTILILTHDIIPTSVARGQEAVPAYGLTLSRRSETCPAPLYLVALGFKVESLDRAPMDPAEVIDRMKVEIIGLPDPPCDRADGRQSLRDNREALVEIGLACPALIPAQDSLAIEIIADISPRAIAPGFAIALDERYITINHEGCPAPVLLLRGEGAPGPVTATTTIISRTLAGSFSNYPNPFSAGREMTTFAFFLPKSAETSLRLYTGFGSLVRTLDHGTARAGGRVHEDTRWDGRDETGTAVQNGTYFAVLSVRYEDGTHDEAVRKVAVLR